MGKNKVNVTVNLVDKFSKTLKKLEGQLEKIDKTKVRPKFDFDDNGQIESIKAQLASIDDVVNTKLNVLGKPALKETQASVKSLSGVENVYVRTHDHELAATIAKMEALRRRQNVRKKVRAQEGFLNNIQDFTQKSRKAEGRASRRPAPPLPNDTGPIGAARRIRERKRESAATTETRHSVRRALESLHTRNFQLSDSFVSRNRLAGKGGPVGGVTGMDLDDLGKRFSGDRGRRRGRGIQGFLAGMSLGGVIPRIKKFFKKDDSGRSPADRSASTALRLIPRGQLSQDLAAFFMPFMFTAYTAAMGAVAAATAPAVAGLTALATGILGFGENAAEAMKLAEVRIRIFNRELFKAFKPTSQTFAPFVDQWFKTLPNTLARELGGPMQDMVIWMPTVEAIGSGLLGWTRDFFNLMNRLEPVISRVVMQLGADTGDALLRFFEWLILELDENYQLIKDTLGAFKELAIFIYRVSLLWTQAIANLSSIISGLGKFINMIASSPVLGTIVSWTMSLAILAGVVFKVIGLFVTLSGFVGGAFLSSVAASMGSLIGYLAAVYTALLGVGKLASYVMGVLTLGAALAAGVAAVSYFASQFGGSSDIPDGFNSTSGGGPSRTTPSGGNTINIYGNPDNAQMQEFKDMFPAHHRQENRVSNKMSQG